MGLHGEKSTGNRRMSVDRIPHGKKAIIAIEIGRKVSGATIVISHDSTIVSTLAKLPTALTKTNDVWAFGEHDMVTLGASSSTRLFRGFTDRLFTNDRNERLEEAVVASINTPTQGILLDMYRHCLQHISRCALEQCVAATGQRLLSRQDVQWVVTVPATLDIWGYRFLQLAACEAGLVDKVDADRKDLVFAKEPEAAIVAMSRTNHLHGFIQQGQQVTVLDCGSDMIKLHCFEIQSATPQLDLRHIPYPFNCISFGSEHITNTFSRFMKNLLHEACPELPSANANEQWTRNIAWSNLLSAFEAYKHIVDPTQRRNAGLSLCLTDLLSIDQQYRLKLFVDQQCASADVRALAFHLEAKTLLMSQDFVLKTFFEPTLKSIADALTSVSHSYPDCSRFIVVGGFAVSKALIHRLERLKHELHESVDFLFADDPQNTVLLGAVRGNWGGRFEPLQPPTGFDHMQHSSRNIPYIPHAEVSNSGASADINIHSRDRLSEGDNDGSVSINTHNDVRCITPPIIGAVSCAALTFQNGAYNDTKNSILPASPTSVADVSSTTATAAPPRTIRLSIANPHSWIEAHDLVVQAYVHRKLERCKLETMASRHVLAAKAYIRVLQLHGDSLQQQERTAFTQMAWFEEVLQLRSSPCAVTRMHAHYVVGVCWENNIGDSESMDNALEMYKIAATAGHSSAQCRLGMYYLHNNNAEAAKELLEQAKAQQHPEAYYQLGIYHAKRAGSRRREPDASLSEHMFHEAAVKGHASDRMEVCVSRLQDKEVDMLVRLAEKQHAGSEYALAEHYLSTGDDQRAFKLLRMSVGHYRSALAIYALAGCYFHGRGVQRNREMAAILYEEAAETDHAEAQFRIGLCYAHSWGVECNYSHAKAWFARAISQGHTAAVSHNGWLSNLPPKVENHAL